MEFCGLYVSDGSMSDGHISIARDGAASYMAHYRQCMLHEFHAAQKGGHKAWDEREPVSIFLREGERDTRFSSKAAVKELRDLGFSGTAHTKRIPAWVFGLSRPLQLAFLRGMVDGDGYVNEDGWITWSSCSQDLLDDVRQLLMMAGIPCGHIMRYAQAGAVVINGREVNRGAIYQLWSCSKEHNRLIGAHDERYRGRLAGNVTARANCWSADFMGRGPKGSRPGEGFDLPGRLMKVQSIDVGRVCQPVYDLGVEGTHSFIADGVIVHNSWGSGIEQLMIGFIQFTMVPWVRIWEQEIARKLLTEAERKAGFYVKFNTNALLRGDMAARQAFYAGGIQNGWLMPNEVREKEDMEPLPGLDRPAPPPRTPAPSPPDPEPDEDMPDAA
jgi:hypothetical protein